MPEIEIDFEALSPTRRDLSLRFADVDSMRVAHHSVSLHWFEQLRFWFMHNVLDVSMETLLASRLAFPLTGCAVQYKHAIGLTDAVFGFSRVAAHANATFTFSYWIFTERRPAKPSVLGSTTHCYVDEQMSLLIKPPQLFRDATERARRLHPGCVLAEGRT